VAVRHCRLDFLSKPLDRARIDAELPLAHQHFAGKLQEDAVETRARHGAAWSVLFDADTLVFRPGGANGGLGDWLGTGTGLASP
jgi:hypothetical protein